MRRPAAVTMVTLLLLVAGMLGAGPASAHAVRTGADPAPDAVLQTAPQRVTATFNEALQSTFAAMTIVGPDGNLWSSGDVEVQGPNASVAMLPVGPAGVYTVNYRVTSADGHPISGNWSFRVDVAGSGTPGPPAASAAAEGDDASGSGLSVWPFVVAAAAIVAGGALWAVRRRS